MSQSRVLFEGPLRVETTTDSGAGSIVRPLLTMISVVATLHTTSAASAARLEELAHQASAMMTSQEPDCLVYALARASKQTDDTAHTRTLLELVRCVRACSRLRVRVLVCVRVCPAVGRCAVIVSLELADVETSRALVNAHTQNACRNTNVSKLHVNVRPPPCTLCSFCNSVCNP